METTDGGFHHTVFSIGGTLLRSADAFSELQTGLDHIGFGCPDRNALTNWEGRLDELGISHGGIVDAHYGSGLSFRDPGGIALELFVPPG